MEKNILRNEEELQLFDCKAGQEIEQGRNVKLHIERL
jgi:hypothetical protein